MSHDIKQLTDLQRLRQSYESEMLISRSNGQKFASGSNAHEYAVKAVPLYTADGTPANRWGNVRTDTGVCIGDTSDRYGIVQNTDFTRAIEDGFGEYGLVPTKRESIVTMFGARAHIQYDFSTRTAEVKKGDIVALRIIANNSFDGKSKSSISVGALRLVCLNGMTSYREDLSMSVRHSTNVSADFVRKVVGLAMNEWETLNSVWRNLANYKISQEQGYYIIDNLRLRGHLSTTQSKEIIGVWERPLYEQDADRSLWNLYNAHTQVLTHSSSVNRYEFSQRTSHDVFRNLRDASVDEHSFLSLSTPAKDNNN
jgi:hypothetical protein